MNDWFDDNDRVHPWQETIMTNQDIADWIDYKSETAKVLRDARAAELEALFTKLESDCRLTYQMELAKRAKV